MQTTNFLWGRSEVKEKGIQYIPSQGRYILIRALEQCKVSGVKAIRFLDILKNPEAYKDSEVVVDPVQIIRELPDIQPALEDESGNLITGDIASIIAANFATIYLSKELRRLDGMAAILLYEEYLAKWVVPNDVCRIILLKSIAKRTQWINLPRYKMFVSGIIWELKQGLHFSSTHTVSEFNRLVPRVMDIFGLE